MVDNTLNAEVLTKASEVIIPRIYDAVTLRLNDSPCYIAFEDDPKDATKLLGSTATHSATISSISLQKQDDAKCTVSGYITVDGKCEATDQNGTYYMPCQVTLPFSAVLRYPQCRSGIKTLATVSFDFKIIKKDSEVYIGVANGVTMISVCTGTPI